MRMAMSSKPPITFSSWHVSTTQRAALLLRHVAMDSRSATGTISMATRLSVRATWAALCTLRSTEMASSVEADIANCVTLSIVRGIGPSNTNTENSHTSGNLTRFREFDRYKRLSHLRFLSEGSLSFDIEHEYDLLGNRIARRDSNFGREEYSYDVLGRITAHFKQQWAGSDPVSRHASTAEPRFRESELDCMGRLSTCGKLELHWNAAGRLEKAVNDGQATTFAYDAFGRRIEKRSQDAVDKFYWDGESLALEVRSHAEEEDESKEHILFPGTFEPLALIRRSRGGPASVYLYHTDPNGSPVRLTDCEGRVVWSANYHPDGSADVEFGGSLTNLRLQGQYFDSETLLQHRYFRVLLARPWMFYYAGSAWPVWWS